MALVVITQPATALLTRRLAVNPQIEETTMFDFQSAMAEGKARAQRQRNKGTSSAVQVFTTSQERWSGWTEEDWEANDMNAAIDDAEAHTFDDADEWQSQYDAGEDVDAPSPEGEPVTEEKPTRLVAPREPRNTVAPIKGSRQISEHTMTPKQYLAALKKLGLTAHYSAGPALGISTRMSARYAAGTHAIPATLALLVRALVKLQSACP